MQAKAGVSGVFNLVPAGTLQRKRRFVAGRFPVVRHHIIVIPVQKTQLQQSCVSPR